MVVRPRPRRGFSLLEIVLVLLIIVVLLALSVPGYRSVKDRAQMAALREELLQLRSAQEAFYAEHRSYATTLSELNFQTDSTLVIDLTSNDPRTGWTATVTSPLLNGGSGSCFLSSGSDNGTGSSSSGVECNSFVLSGAGQQRD